MDDLNEEVGVGELNATVEETLKELKRRRGPTIMFDVTRIRSLGDKKVVRYNEDGAPIGENGAKLKSFIGSATHYHVPITYMSWKSVPAELKDKIFTTVEAAFVIDPRSRKNVLQTAGISFRQFKNWLTTKYIIPHKDEPQLLQVPPEKYSFIEQNHWEEFVRSRLSETFQEKRKLQQDRRSKNKYNHRISRKGYANLKEEMDEISMNTDSSSVNRHCSNDVLTQALGTKEHNGRVRGVGGYVTPTTYFHSVKKTSKDEANILVENEELRRRVSELEAQIRSNLSTPLSAHGSCSRPIVLEGIEEKGKRIEVESLDKPKQKEKKGKEVMKMNEPELDVLKERDLIKMPTEKEVVCESTSTLPLALKSILRYAEKVMEKDSSITFSLPADLFGVSRKTSVLREDIVDLCNMNEVKTFTLVAYMMYLYSSVSGSKENMQYVFVDPSLISSGNTQESRIRNLCSRLMVSKPDQVVLAPFNPGGHWALLAINAYEDTVFYLDSLRTTSKATTRYVTDTAIAIFHSQKNINKSRKQTLWRTCPLQVGSTTCGYYVMKYMREIVNRGSIVISDSIDTRKSYSQAELDEGVAIMKVYGLGMIYFWASQEEKKKKGFLLHSKALAIAAPPPLFPRSLFASFHLRSRLDKIAHPVVPFATKSSVTFSSFYESFVPTVVLSSIFVQPPTHKMPLRWSLHPIVLHICRSIFRAKLYEVESLSFSCLLIFEPRKPF
ncbi:putative serine/threonine-protein kinase nek2 [Cucumis melo var. makuwa]|uniref:Putative serine/threonine-protein kinase nek2 n=1 Tax=Cucumis melo var. makuwa TaxID=1194695 RepID=A0A5D3DZ21_CUCMM|nr:putative serine/threonine-protein kinase nek2 [Cucumis melo var. makuwa]